MTNELEKIKLHFFYCAIILVMIIIAVATDRWSLQPKFTEFLSNAATMTSLVLGLVAIFYSFIANDGLSKSLGSIDTVSEEIKSSKQQIAQQVAAGAETTKSAERSAMLIGAASSSIESSLTSLSETLAAIQTHTEVLHGSLAGLPTRLDQLESKVINATRSLQQKPVQNLPPNKELIHNDIVRYFLRTSSINVNLLTYACVLAFKKQKEIIFSDFSAAMGRGLESYYFGYFDSMDSVQLLNGSRTSDQPRKYLIHEMHPYLIENTEKYVKDYLDSEYKDKNPDFYKRFSEALEKVEKLF